VVTASATAPIATPSAASSQFPIYEASPSDAGGNARVSKKPALPTESGDLPSPSAPEAPPVSTDKDQLDTKQGADSSASSSRKPELKLGSPTGNDALAKKAIVPIDATKIADANNRTGRIRTTEDK
jgi:hypothetical protein